MNEYLLELLIEVNYMPGSGNVKTKMVQGTVYPHPLQ